MKKVKIFAENSHYQLQASVNDWLERNHDISVVSSSMEVKGKDASEYLFYIMYAGIEAEEKGKLQTLAVVDQSAASADPGKIVEVITNPEATIKN